MTTPGPDSGAALHTLAGGHDGVWPGAVVRPPGAERPPRSYFHQLRTWDHLETWLAAPDRHLQQVDRRRWSVADGAGSDLALVSVPLETANMAGQRRIEETVLIGYSQGGLVAKAFALESLAGEGNPLRISRMIYLATPHDGVPAAHVYNRLLDDMDRGGTQAGQEAILALLGSGKALVEGGEEAIGFKRKSVELTRGLFFMHEVKDPCTISYYYAGYKSWADLNSRLKDAGIREYCVSGWSTNQSSNEDSVAPQAMAGGPSMSTANSTPAAATGGFYLTRALDGLEAGDGTVNISSSVGVRNGPDRRVVKRSWRNLWNLFSLGGHFEYPKHSTNNLAAAFTWMTDKLGSLLMLHTLVDKDRGIFEEVGKFIKTGNPRVIEIQERRELLERLYYEVLGRQGFPLYPKPELKPTPVPGAVPGFPADQVANPGDYLYGNDAADSYDAWARRLVDERTPMLRGKFRFSDDYGLYTYMWLSDGAQNESDLRAILAGSEERYQKVAHLYRHFGASASPQVLSGVARSSETMDAIKNRLRLVRP